MSRDQTLTSLPLKDGYGGDDPRQLQPAVPEFKPNRRDEEIIRACRDDSFFRRCIPFSIIGGGAVSYAVKRGQLAPHPKYGAVPKMAGALLAGFILGKLSYIKTCKEKLMADPESELGRRLREQKNGFSQDSSFGRDPITTGPNQSNQDVHRDQFIQHPNQQEPYMHPEPSYEEMRRQNRLQRPTVGRVFRQPNPDPVDPKNETSPSVEPNTTLDGWPISLGSPEPQPSSPQIGQKPKVKRNKWGDEIEEV